jgi:predicted dehydrogenase
MAKVRVGLIGCGGMAQTHAARFQSNRDRMELAYAVDVNREAAQAVADLSPGCRVETEWRRIINEVDAAFLVLPHHLHLPASLDFLNAGKHVLVEKPLGRTEAECLQMIEAAERNQRVLMVGYIMRYHPLVLKLKEIVDAKIYGEAFNFSIWTEQYTHFPEGHWTTSKELMRSGQFVSHGCHYIDILLWFLGKPIRGMHLGTRKGTPWMEGEGTSNCIIEFEEGVTAYHYGTWGSKRQNSHYLFQIDCTGAVLQLRFGENRLVAMTPQGEHVCFEYSGEKATYHEVSHFLDCVETGRKPFTDAVSSLQGLRVIWKMYEAERTHTLADLCGMGLH